ncbi:glycerophosphoryl diester phosphodiesterase [Ereboglobus sp. PH5-5]|uniref:glycerophosphodiester phosphodiesterase n=1 Tax=Ereboglobus sp. PH5-5 TaxID=2940529 RepID=UPI00240542CE|nr:glycerophosphodiester phosphodiesterase family protein [Ereboglobus sp. PH5-5]MDF9834174.1 glycerophosphoryl diester phosphodiesterase [Ereboglobus sp. PH5-5]
MSPRIALAWLLVAAAPTALFAQAQTSAPKSAWNVTDHIALKDFVVQSHRGAGNLAEEGTLESFKLGWALGTIPESDIRATKDGVIVSFHDGSFKRLIKDADPVLKKSSVEKSTWEFLQTLDVGAWKGDSFRGRRVPKMSDIFAYMADNPDLRLYLDIKKVDFAVLAKLVKDAGVADRVILASRHPAHHIEWKKLVPESGTLLWMSAGEQEITKMIDELVASGDIKSITSMQLHVHPNRNGANYDRSTDGGRDWKKIPCTDDPSEPFNHTRSFIIRLGERLRSLGILYQSLPYMSRDGVYAELMDLGVASFATDHPDVAMLEIRKYYAKRGKK